MGFMTNDHDMLWNAVNMRLWSLGYRVKWQPDYRNDSHVYAIFKGEESKPMGIYNEEEAKGMVKMLLSNDEHERN